MIKIILHFTNTYWDISMSIINNQYRSTCRPSTSISYWNLGLNAPIHLSMISCRILFHSSTIALFKESRSVIPRLRYIFCSKSQFLSHLYFPHFLRDLNHIVMWVIEFCHLISLFTAKERSFAMFSEYTLTITFMNGSCAFLCSNQ